jgi:predicted ribosomally synthesized peptide with nif11-like leader
MSIRNAILLLNAIDDDSVLREEIYLCNEADQVMNYLKSRGYHFDMDELEDAIHHLHVQCQTLEDAQCLLHKADWLRFLMFVSENSEK